MGSSPRVRGKLSHGLVEETADRIIPASAGQTGELCWLLLVAPDHPRECGANTAGQPNPYGLIGSSPRVRGKRPRSGDVSAVGRIIPASAGQTPLDASLLAVSSDHPRECGANRGMTAAILGQLGSSPRVRGKPALGQSLTELRRIIPASAGQTKPSSARHCCPSDHPRECGANDGWPGTTFTVSGSSPRVRGKPTGRA
ncbi:hypothetical protein BMIN_0704 [Bifidobacterium minimum]|uniref:Uncharacterized protein n=1 Tax=Bifidobacterium minimum TaxID=1693 RepID=A0A087BPP1_9BIFI|nr:hypothetical protein BMIN_0704 [Bifidobacterium minimum]